METRYFFFNRFPSSVIRSNNNELFGVESNFLKKLYYSINSKYNIPKIYYPPQKNK
ncbi:hypothetical protein D925_02583 [Enterococcus faecalis B83616-1]|nr:hypothetical protein D925_02583 [Enterococcus faecalis B83616-1]